MSTKRAIQGKREERRGGAAESGCVVCGNADARVLSYTRLEGGERVTVCGSHRVAHQRSETHARDVAHLKRLVGERRAS